VNTGSAWGASGHMGYNTHIRSTTVIPFDSLQVRRQEPPPTPSHASQYNDLASAHIRCCGFCRFMSGLGQPMA
jgi:hypothetical protein